MSDYDRNKVFPKKKFFSSKGKVYIFEGISSLIVIIFFFKETLGHVKPEGRSYSNSRNESGTSLKLSRDPIKITSLTDPPKKQPTILLKARESNSEDLSASPKRIQKDEPSITIASSKDEGNINILMYINPAINGTSFSSPSIGLPL